MSFNSPKNNTICGYMPKRFAMLAVMVTYTDQGKKSV